MAAAGDAGAGLLRGRGAADIAWIDQSDFPEIFGRANPHRAIGEPDTTINRNYLVHHREAERFPWRRSILALHVARLFSVFPGRGDRLRGLPHAAAAASGGGRAARRTAFAAFLPQFVFISSSASNDNAVNAAAALVLWQLTALLVEGGPAAAKAAFGPGRAAGPDAALEAERAGAGGRGWAGDPVAGLARAQRFVRSSRRRCGRPCPRF